MPFPYKHVLLIGATSGIGKAMADRFVLEGIKVTVVGRRQDRLDAFIHEHGSDKVDGRAFDIVDTQGIPGFVTSVLSKSSDIDCLMMNAGVQRRFDFTQPERLDLNLFHREMNINFTSFVALVHAILPSFLARKTKTCLLFTSSHLAIVPAAFIPAYSASKAALNAFTLCIQEQLRGTLIKVTEISPPPVQTELHDVEMGAEAGRAFGMPLDKFTEEAWSGLASGSDQVVVGGLAGSSAEALLEVITKRRSLFERLAERMSGRVKD